MFYVFRNVIKLMNVSFCFVRDNIINKSSILFAIIKCDSTTME